MIASLYQSCSAAVRACLTCTSTTYAPVFGVMRQIANGRSAGSRLTRCSLPCQIKIDVAHHVAHRQWARERATVIDEPPKPRSELPELRRLVTDVKGGT